VNLITNRLSQNYKSSYHLAFKDTSTHYYTFALNTGTSQSSSYQYPLTNVSFHETPEGRRVGLVRSIKFH
jgi:hypothetical protein